MGMILHSEILPYGESDGCQRSVVSNVTRFRIRERLSEYDWTVRYSAPVDVVGVSLGYDVAVGCLPP